MKEIKKADWVVLRMLMVACPNIRHIHDKLETARGIEYLLKKYGDRVLETAIKALWDERREPTQTRSRSIAPTQTRSRSIAPNNVRKETA
jgi:hypothetical protein